ncbi:hypothetical protein ACSBOB_20695 [Mesorhizobium sp. ASY16-5R]|uniref:hypothetical protein n=1 Tax=Mesorhizobium sp. ASY16-5R TaxID=3445772 RepID=UPI003F9F286D
MTMIEWFAVGVLTLCALSVVPFVLEWVSRNFFTGGEFQRDFDNFLEDRRRAGVPIRDALTELEVREFFIMLREDASDSVLRNPGDWLAELNAAKARIIDTMTRRNRAHLIPLLVGMFEGHTYSVILYPDAIAALEAETLFGRGQRFNYSEHANLHAALRVVGR